MHVIYLVLTAYQSGTVSIHVYKYKIEWLKDLTSVTQLVGRGTWAQINFLQGQISPPTTGLDFFSNK